MRVGDVVSDRFEVERSAGAGGMGVVFRARDRVTGEPVALKVLAPGTDHEARFAREARVLASLRHPAIVRYVAHGEITPGTAYLAMAWIEGQELAERLRTRGSQLSLRESLDVVVRVAEALGAAHAIGVIHRDVKPSNVILEGGDPGRAQVIDFGIARDHGHATAALTAGPIGTLAYMSPEQARGDGAVDARTDVFALGSLLYECVTGRRAFHGEHHAAVLAKILLDDPPRPSDQNPALPAVIDEHVLAMLARDPADRPANGADVAARLRAVRDALDGDYGAPPAGSRPIPIVEVLTDGERHAVSVILARARPLDGDATLDAPGLRARADKLKDIVAPFGAALEVLADGTVVALVTVAEVATDRAARAARVALAIAPHLPRASVFIATGRVVNAARFVVGEAVDRAYALAAGSDDANGDCVIRVDDTTAALLDARFEVEPDPSRGGAVLRRERDGHEVRRTLLGKPTACVGRERELAALVGIAREAFDEPIARVVIVSAPAGVGKSRVAAELVARAVEAYPDLEVLVGRADAVRAGAPHALVLGAIRRAAGVVDGEPDAASERKLRDHVARVLDGGDEERVADFLAELVGVAPAAPGTELRAARLDTRVMADQLRRAFVDFVRAECRAHPVLLVLDDLHFGDRPSLDLVDAALAAVGSGPLFVVGLARPDVHAMFPSLFAAREVQEVRLGKLVRRSAEQLVRAVLGERATADVVARIVERADGHAFHLEELIRAVAEGKGDTFPETVVAMVDARLDELAPAARHVLRAASVFGGVFWESGVCTLVGEVLARDVGEWVRTLVAGEYVTTRPGSRFAGERELAFRHDLLREAAYARLTESDRALGHRLAATWLEAHGERSARVLAAHHALGDRPEGSIPFWEQAAEQALESDDVTSVLDCVERGLARGASGEQRGRFFLIQSEAHRIRGDWTAAEQASVAGFELTPRASATATRAAGALASAHVWRRRAEPLRAAARVLADLPPSERATSDYVATVARVASQLWQIDAGSDAERLLAATGLERAADTTNDPVVHASFARLAAFRALSRGDVAGWARDSARWADACERSGDRRAACTSRANVGNALLRLGRYEEALDTLQRAIADARAMQLESIAVVAEDNLALALLFLDRVDEASAIRDRHIVHHRATGNLRVEGLLHAYSTLLALRLGDPEDARARAAEALRTLPSSTPLHAFALAMDAKARLASGDAIGALASARAALAHLEAGGGVEEGEAHVHLVLVEALLACGHDVLAREAAGRAAALVRARAVPIDDEASRTSFLSRVPEHAATFALEARLSSAE